MLPQPQPGFDNIKSMLLTMMMVKGDQTNIIHTLSMMSLISVMDIVGGQLKRLFNTGLQKLENYLTKTTNTLSITNTTLSIKSSILVKIDTQNVTSNAIIDVLTHLPHVKCILFNNNSYTINHTDEIEIYKGVYAQLTTDKLPPHTMTENNEKEHASFINVYSYTLSMDALRYELNDVVKNFMIKVNNKLGNNIYYFSEMPLAVYRDANGRVDQTRTVEHLHFSMKPFVTNRLFDNLFGDEIDRIRKRVEFFRDNKEWYDNKGVPYTLGILVSGEPGSGKTSLIKCIANEMKRHIVNIHLSDTMTKLQLENLFYNEQLHITQNGKTETYIIPINKRFYVLEDVDCQCDIILDREVQTAEQELVKKNKDLKNELEQLKYALAEINSGKKMVLNSKPPPLEETTQVDKEKITLSFLLNLFDGVLETPGRIIFITTNYINKLDKALIRPGRIDVISRFGFTNHSQLIDIIQHRYDTTLTETQKQLISGIQITPAEVSRILFENFDNLENSLQALVEYANDYKNFN